MNASRRPDFLLLGAAKCGTTSLASYLAQHPQIFFSEPKEPLFFEAEYEKGLDWYWQRYFRGWRGEPVVGEGRVWNLYLPFVAPRIAEALPDARLVALLRDPVERAHSHWWHRHSRGEEPLGFEEAVAADRARIDRGERFEGQEGARRWREGLYPHSVATRHRALLDPGFYAEQIERYLALFPRERLHVILYDDLARDPEGVLRALFRFLGVDEDAAVADTRPRNVRREAIRSPGSARLFRMARTLQLRRVVPAPLRPVLRGLLPERPARMPALASGTRRELVAYFEPHTRRLETLLDRDLDAWRREA